MQPIHNPWFWLALFGASAVVYVLPTLIGLIRRVDSPGLVITFNLLGAITAGAGWVAAMILAFGLPRRLPPEPVYPPVAAYPGAVHAPYDGEHW